MAKTKKKKNYRLRKSVRRTLGALFMISAIIIAAIPFPDAAATNGVENENIQSRTRSSSSPEITYSVENDEDINDVDNGGVDLDPAGKDIEYSYGVYNISNQWVYQWQFGFFDAGVDNTDDDDDGDGNRIGIISKYNDEYKVPEITLKNTINTGYITVDYDEYIKYFNDSPERKLTYNTKDDQNLRAEFEKYFSSALSNFDANVKTYENWLNANPDATEEEINAKKEEVTVTTTPKNLGNNERSRYYCDYVLDSGKVEDAVDNYLYGLDFEMVAVDAYIRNESYSIKYIPKATNPQSTTAPAGYEIDDYGFLYPKETACKLKGIGDTAFQDITSIEILNLPSNISYIGDNAFERSFVKTVTIANVAEIGNAAFKGCSLLATLDIQSQTKTIGTEAFAHTILNKIRLPYSVTKIGEGAFADNYNLETIEFPENSNGEVTICDFAFYNCPNLSSINLSDKRSITSIGKGAFALAVSVEDGMKCTSFSFPSSISDATNLGDYILSNRIGLVDVIMPSSLGSREPSDSDIAKVTIPLNTFKGCNNLGSVTFPDKNELGSCGYVVFDSDLFADVTNKSFYVAGPGKNFLGEIASPRKCTWKCTNAYEEAIPYVYKLDGKEVFEVSQVDVNDTDKSYLMSVDANGILQSCNFIDSDDDGDIDGYDAFDITKLTIPGEIAGGLSIKGLAEGCFSQPYKDFIHHIIELEISDGGELSEIAAGVFKGAKKLKKVYLGDSIQKIGDEAFRDCKELVEIEFSKPKSGNTELGREALTTNSDKLTVTGKIEEGYGPFEWAMDPENYINSEHGIRVCYESGKPYMQRVILDNRNNLPTLIDYLQFEDLNSIETKDKNGNIVTVKDKMDDRDNPDMEYTLMDEDIIEAVSKLEIPRGVESIDVKGFIEDESNKNNVVRYLSDDSNFNSYMTYGLFNGECADGNDVSAVKPMGNDRLEEVIMYSVKYLPNQYPITDYWGKTRSADDVIAINGLSGGAFYSCENLTHIQLGEIEDIGQLPFEGCYKLNSVGLGSEDSGNTTDYVCDNKIIYKKVGDNNYEIIQCLGSRGDSGAAEDYTVSVNSNDSKLANVSEIAIGAFSDCPYLRKVDFEGNTLLKKIPDKCFLGDEPLPGESNYGMGTIILPEQTRTIGHYAMAHCDNIDLTIKGVEVTLPSDAFDGTDRVKVKAKKDTAAYNTVEDMKLEVEPLPEAETTYTVTFYDYDYKTILAQDTDVKYGETVREPKTPTREGYEFERWSSDAWSIGITDDLDIIAIYKTATTSNNGNNNNSNSGSGNGSNSTGTGDTTGGTQVNGGIDLNGDGIPDVDKDGNKLYKLTVTNGEGGGYYKAGQTVTIKAGNAPKGTGFAFWSCSNESLIFEDYTDWITTLTMINSDVTVICNFRGYYSLEVEYGSGSGSYPAGAKVAISAVEAPQGRKFASWVVKEGQPTVEDSKKATTTITMPTGNAKITATYMDTGKTSVSGNSTSSKNNTSVIITKPGISDKDKASAYVSGSSDNFIVKISESLDAADEVQRALQKKYPDMSRIKYFAMDISLYDAKGENKITNTDGLKVNITMPIPDALKEYAGNNRVGAVVNGELESINPKFTTIDGIPSITFTATHFSPYTIYVDTGNMTVSNTLDSTPKTGDIHPKWFLSLGLACISIILFTKRDRRYTIKA